MADIQCKTAVNTRATLASRLPKKKAEPISAGASLHRKAETTYDVTYVAPPAEALAEANRGRAAAARQVGGSAREGGGLADGGPGAAGSSGHDQNAARQPYNAAYHPSSEWESASHAASRNVQPEQQLDFFSTARKIERDDDERRGGLVGSMQRSLDIRTKRADDAGLRPPTPTYLRAEPQPLPPIVAQERFGAKRNYLDLVECTQLKPETEEQLGFGEAPLTRLPGETLSQDLRVQSKVITEMGTSHELFRGTAKYLKDTPVGYTGHVPMADRNLAAIHHSEDAHRLFARSHMTLAEHGGGAHGMALRSTVVTRRRRGNKAKPPQALPPKSTESINSTAQGRAQQMTLYGTLEREQQMNIRDDAQGQNYF